MYGITQTPRCGSTTRSPRNAARCSTTGTPSRRSSRPVCWTTCSPPTARCWTGWPPTRIPGPGPARAACCPAGSAPSGTPPTTPPSRSPPAPWATSSSRAPWPAPTRSRSSTSTAPTATPTSWPAPRGWPAGSSTSAPAATP
ncbi:hypothetical protein ACFQ60_37635 [Streptomyces zhihengii]